MIRTCYW